MPNKTLLTFVVVAGLLTVAVYLWIAPAARLPEPPTALSLSPAGGDIASAITPAPSPSGVEPSTARADAISALKAQLRDHTQNAHARQGEATFAFKDNAAYQNFLARAAQAGIPVLGKIDALHSVRVSTDALDALANDLFDHEGDYADVAANYTLSPPATAPAAEARAARTEVPLGNHLLSFLGVTGDTQTWGRGVTIAVIDSGIQSDPTFGKGRLRSVDIGSGTSVSTDKEGGHGTAVAALAAGASADAQGVAPSANLLSIRVADSSGQSDIFSVSQAIVAAVDQGAQIINVSLGGYGTSTTLGNALDYARSHGAVIVAAAGNDQAPQLMWPAADSRVISVGAVDALGQQVIFSNSGPQLQITAPGYGVQTAWTNGGRVLMDGTSASTPIVAGSIAALMSVTPGISANDAWKILQQYSSDGGPPGADPDYGHGVINLGWAMARNDTSRLDTAISSHYYDASSGMMDIVVQNRSGQAVGGMNLTVAVNGAETQYPVSWLNPGAVQVVQIPVSQAQIVSQGKIQFVTQLNNPSSVVDQVPANNRKSSSLSAPPTSASPSPAPGSGH